MNRTLIDDMAPPDRSEPYRLMVFKRALVARYGVSEGFRRYQAAFVQARKQRLADERLISARDYARSGAPRYRELDHGGQSFTVTPPRIIGPGDSRPFRGVSRTTFVACFSNALLCARSGIVHVGGVALGDFQNDERTRFDDQPELDATLFAVHGDVAYAIEDQDAPTLELDEAYVSLLGPHSKAFGHWVWHLLPTLITALNANALSAMPILIDRGMPPSHREALVLAIGDRDMPIVELEPAARARVRRAWYVPTLFYVPYLPVNNERWRWDYLSTPPSRFTPILQALSRSAAGVSAASGRGGRLYFARRAHLRRRLINAEQIEAVARSRGFSIVYPEELPFAQQTRLVRDARYIVGPEGSAMFLNFYAEPGMRLAILTHPHTSLLTNYTAPIETRGVDVTLVTGPIVNENDSAGYPNFGYRHFADYTIDPDAFATFLDGWQSAHA